MSKLAINGGEKTRSKPFPGYNTIGQEEKDAVMKVLDSGCLSKFLGAWHNDFYGGTEVRKLEEAWQLKFKVKHAIAVNSATSGLICAVGATGVGAGDEVIVSPYTMSASASSVVIYNAIPVFADVESDFFCLDPDSIEKKITERTKAIVVVDIFGQPYDKERINEIAKKHNLFVIEDCAQAPGAMYGDAYAGTLGDIGVFSLNYHKHIHSGEGGIVVTDNDELAEKIRMIRNHAEAVVENRDYPNIINMIGYNFRMTEIEAAIAYEQLKKLDGLISERIENVHYLEKKLAHIPFLSPSKVRDNCKHVYYIHTFIFDEKIAGIGRDRFVDAVKAELPHHEYRETEGVKIGSGYVKPLYLQPMYQQEIGFGDKGCPFKCPLYKGELNYHKGLCSVCENLHEEKLITHEFMVNSMMTRDLDDVIEAFIKVWENIGEL